MYKLISRRIQIFVLLVIIGITNTFAKVDSLICGLSECPDTLSLLSTIGEDITSLMEKSSSEQSENREVPRRIIDKSLVVGTIEGSADVTPTGASTYCIPIDVPKGYDGFVPSVKVIYNSQSGNDILGYGWNLAATSMISRSGKNIYYDNESQEVKSDDSDNLVLDGQRLLLFSGQNFVNGAKYRLETDRSTDIEYKVVNGNQFFVVRTKDGMIKEYGTSTDSRVGNGTVWFWMLTSVTNNRGYCIRYSYVKYNNEKECYLNKISYGNNGSVSVNFEYEERDDKYSSYFVGLEFTMTKRLKTITTKQYNSYDVSKYVFDYIYDGFYSKLFSITKYGKDGKEHYNPTLIEYGGTKQGSEDMVFFSPKRNGIITLFADYNGDGKTSLISFPNKSNYSDSDYIIYYSYMERLGSKSFVKKDSIRLSSGFKNVILADVNGDGKKDLVLVTKAPNGTYRYNYYESEGNKFKYNYRGFNDNDYLGMAADFNGDGREEILIKGSQKVYNYYGSVIATGGIDDWGKAYVENYYPNNRFFGDFNGNGKTNILCSNSSGAWVYELQGSKFVRLSSFQTSDIKNYYFTYCGDFNGDGKTDLILQNNNNLDDISIIFSSGISFVKKTIQNANIRSLVKVGDFNRDSKSDIFHMEVVNGKLIMKVGIFNGIEFVTKNYNTLLMKAQDINKYSAYDDIMFPLVDLDGDGRSEFCCACYNDVCIVNSFDDEKGRLVECVTDGLGQSVLFDYKVLTDVAVCDNSNNEVTFPLVGSLMPLIVASEMYVRSGNSVDNFMYNYKNPCLHVQGKGFLGFSEITSFDRWKGLKTITEYGMNKSYYHPYVNSQVIKNRSGIDVSKVVYDNAFINYGKKFFLSYVRKKTEKNIIAGTTVVTDFVVDDSGNVLSSVTDYGTGLKEMVETTYEGKTDDDNWIYVPSVIINTTINGSDTWKEKVVMDYDENFWLAKQTKYVGDGTMQKSEDSYIYNENGTISKVRSKSFNSENTLITEYLYKSNTGVDVEDIIDARNQKTHYEYNWYGELVKIEKSDGTGTKYEHDGFGHVLKEIDNDGIIRENISSWDNSLSNSLYKYVLTESGKPDVVIYYDAQRREIRRAEQRFDGSYLCLDRIYDEYTGRLEKESLPFKEGNSVLWNIYSYDDYGRLTEISYSSGKKDAYSYSGLKVTSEENGITKETLYDNMKRILSVTDLAGTISYKLRADGQPSMIISPSGITTTFEYDAYGRKISIVDPSVGTKKYAYDSSGNLSKETSADGKSIIMSYNIFGDIVEKITPEFKTRYEYDPNYRIVSVSTDNGISKSYTYDDFGRIVKEREVVAKEQWLEKSYKYSDGNISSVNYITGLGLIGVENRTYSNGVLSEVNFNNLSVWKLEKESDKGMPVSVVTGGLKRKYSYDQYGFEIGRTALSVMTNNVIMDLSCEVDVISENLKWRKDNIRDLKEVFIYDDMDRLESYGTNKMEYDNNGNITYKSDIGARFVYSTPGKPYAVSDIYVDCNAALPAHSQNVTYTSFMRPLEIISDESKASFVYDDSYLRKIMTFVNLSSNIGYMRYYISDNYEIDINQDLSGINKDSKLGIQRLYIGGDAYSAPVVIVSENNGKWIPYYICRDHLGSITHITDSIGNLIYEYSYDVWGRLRDPDTHDVYIADAEPQLFLSRGYCGHEHLTEFGLINMNARLYDPMLGRFISPDSYIQEPYSSQNFNRYSYTLNNPLKYNDKSGDFFVFSIITAITDFVGNIFKHGFNVSQYNWSKTVNAWRIDMGMFRGNVWQALNKWTWGITNSLIGDVTAHICNIGGWVDGVTDLDGMLALSGVTGGSRAFTIGHYSFGPNNYTADWRDHLFVHEYGHYIQSQRMGSFYLPVVGGPSLLSAFFTSKLAGMDHSERWFEVNASKLGAEYFDKHYGRKVNGYDEKSADYFDIKSFVSGYSSYKNPRTNSQYQDKFPISGYKIIWWDFIL